MKTKKTITLWTLITLMSVVVVYKVCAQGDTTWLPRDIGFPVPSKERVKEIAEMLPQKPMGFGHPVSERHFWNEISNTEEADRVIKKAIELLDIEPLPVSYFEEQWMAYLEGKTERQVYSDAWEGLRQMFCTLVMAEALEDEGRFIPGIEKFLQVMLSMGTWKYVAGAQLPDADYWYGRKFFIDLVLAQTSLTVATADYWLQDKLNPDIRKRLREYMRKGTFEPHLEMLNTPGMGWFWMKSRNNWNAVCHAGVVGAALTILEDPMERAMIVAGAEISKEYYLEGIGNEGYCEEGIGYWGYGFSNFMVLSEIVRINTQNSIDWLNDPRVAQATYFPSRVEILNGLYPTFSDIRGTYSSPSGWKVDFAEERMGIKKNLIPFWRTAMLEDISSNILPVYGLLQLQNFPVYDFEFNTLYNQEYHCEIRDFYENNGLLITRPYRRNPRGMAASIKGGHNGEGHNHNDIGTFEVVLGSEKLIVDPGAQLYGRNSSVYKGRYESEMMNSYGHPVPVVAGQLQSPGREAKAIIVEKDFSLFKDYIKFDLSSAYNVSSLQNLNRSFTYKRGKTSELIVIDEVEFTQPEEFETALIVDTYNRAIRDQLSCWWEFTGENRWKIQKGDKSIEVTVSSPSNEIILKVKPVEAHVGRMPAGYNPIRLGFALKEKVKSAQIKMQITPVEIPGL